MAENRKQDQGSQKNNQQQGGGKGDQFPNDRDANRQGEQTRGKEDQQSGQSGQKRKSGDR